MIRRAQLLILLGALVGGTTTTAEPSLAQPTPGHVVDQSQACLECHDLSDSLGASVPHAPVADGECSACHNPHVARFAALLKDRPGPLCLSCHQDVEKQLEAPTVHQPVAEGRCADCHEAHGAQHAGLLKSTRQQLCAECHLEVGSWTEKPVQHSPFAQGRCSVCHQSHASQSSGLMVGPGSRICTSCHSVNDAFRAAHSNYPVDRADCHQCHDPHASSRSGLFKEAVHAPFASGSCTQCHQNAGSREPFKTVKPMDQLCGDCHFDQVAVAQAASFPHLSAGGSHCVECHNPHMGDNTALLKGSSTGVCIQCHDPGGARSGAEGTHLTHGEGLECSTCHDPHGGERLLLMADDSNELCGSCHSHQHGVTHPMGEETRDPRTGNPMTCVSCHGIHQAQGEKLMFDADIRDLCVGCHKEFAGG